MENTYSKQADLRFRHVRQARLVRLSRPSDLRDRFVLGRTGLVSMTAFGSCI